MGTFISEKRHWAQVLVLATVYLILATVYWHLWYWVPSINWIGQKGHLQFIGSVGHFFTPIVLGGGRWRAFQNLLKKLKIAKVLTSRSQTFGNSSFSWHTFMAFSCDWDQRRYMCGQQIVGLMEYWCMYRYCCSVITLQCAYMEPDIANQSSWGSLYHIALPPSIYSMARPSHCTAYSH